MAQLKDGTRVYGTFTANTEVVIGTLNVSTAIAASYNTANAAFNASNTGLAAGNSYAQQVGAAGNSYAQQVGSSANSFADATYYKKTGGLISGDVGITGNLTISGEVTYANTRQLQVGDNIITLNADLPLSATPIDNAGIEVNRGNHNSNAGLLWIETTGRWSISGNVAQTVSTFIASNTLVEQYAAAGNAYAEHVGTAANNWSTETFATLSNVAQVYQTTNISFDTANAAFAAANNVAPQVTPSFNTANAAFNTANAAYASGNSNWAVQNLVYATSNVAFDTANAAFASANNVAPQVEPAFRTANNAYFNSNAAFTHANAAFDSANNVAPQIAPAYKTANAAFIHANSAYDKANSGGANVGVAAPVSPVNGQLWWDSNYGKLFIYYTDGDSNQWVEASPAPGIDTSFAIPIYHTANLAFDTANAAFASANNVAPQIAPAFTHANSAYSYANSLGVLTGVAFDTANAAFTSANNVAPQVEPAFRTANNAYLTANAAFAKANAGGANVGQTTPAVATAGSLWWNSDLGRLFIYYTDPANTSAWVETSPSASSIEASIITGYINPVYETMNVAFGVANAAYGTANASYAYANTLLANSTTTYYGTLTVAGNVTFTAANNNLTVPTGPTAGRPSVAANGMIRYNTTLNTFEGYKAGTWGAIGGGATGGGSDDAFYENTANITSDYTITSGKNAMTAGPVTLANNITITIPVGSTWTVV